MSAPDDDSHTDSSRGASRRTLLLGVVMAVLSLVAVATVAVLARSEGSEAALQGTTPRAVAGPVPLTQRGDPQERFPLPKTTLAAFADGRPVDTSAFRGRPLVVNFWATWCSPCVEEMPAFQQVFEDVGDDVAFLGIDVQDAPRNAEPFVTDLAIAYPLAVDPQATYWRQVGGFAMPTTLFVRPSGTVVYRHTGPLDVEELRGLLASELGVADVASEGP